VSGLVLGGCGDDESGTPQPKDPGSVRVHFENVVDGAPLELLTGAYTNAAGNEYVVQRLRFVTSDFTFASGGETFDSGLAHVFFENVADTHSLLLEGVPAGDYTTFRFTFGLDEEDNKDPDQGGTLPQTPEWEAMRWPATWGGGYHYMQLEGFFRTSAGDTASFATHTGRRYAQNDPVFSDDPAPIPHFLDVSLQGTTIAVEPNTTTDITLTMNLNAWYGDPQIYDLDTYTTAGMMMITAAQDILEANGADAFAVRTGTPGP